MKLVYKYCLNLQVLTITDVVLNHTANESEWLQEHPDATFNMINSPHLRPAYLLDRALHYFSLEIADKKWIDSGIPPTIQNQEHVNVRNLHF